MKKIFLRLLQGRTVKFPRRKNIVVWNLGTGGMNDLKFTTAADFMAEQDPYYYPGSDPQE
jgi:hypothetical protein